MYQDIRIKHFRGFDSLTIEGLSQVNVFLGRNNSGKTSILEAIFLLSGNTEANLAAILRVTRGLSTPQAPLSYAFLFHKRDYSNPIIVWGRSSIDLYRRELTVTPIFSDNDKIQDSIALEGIKSTTGTLYPTDLHLYYGLFGQTYEQTKKQDSLPGISADYLPSQKLDANTLPNIKRIIEVGLKDKLVGFLSSFDKRVVGVELIGEEILLRLEGLEYLMPLQVAGDGLRRFVSVWSAVANPDNEVVLIDEVDNGIHHSSYRLLWEMILRTAKENNVQLFITTHSDESLLGLAEANESLADGEGAEAAIYSVAHTKSGARAYRYEVASYEQVREGHVDPRN